jgi:hypothetical protein
LNNHHGIKKVNNTIVANNITAKARCEIWKYSRALRGYQSITDGFSYSPDKIHELKRKERKPGLETLSNLQKLNDHKNIKLITLNNQKNWEQIIKDNTEVLKNLEKYAIDHIKKFWANYNEPIQYNIEHKHEHTATKMLYFKKAHNLRSNYKNDITIKIRGLDSNEETLIKQIYLDSLHDPNIEIKNIEYEIQETNTIKDYLSDENKKPGHRRKEKRIMKHSITDNSFKNSETKQKIKKMNIDIIETLKEQAIPISMKNIQEKRIQIITEIE